jgi:photosystem II stability/assembly factor-like uncharacterized protein
MERTRVLTALPPHPGTEQWAPVGPTNIGGRMTSLVCVAQRPEVLWGGAAGGGVWKSDDGGQHWRALWHSQPTLNVGALAIDPVNPSIIYCGTGEANLSADSYPGVGIFRTIDGGDSWHILAPAVSSGLPTRIGVIAVNPFDPSHIFVGGVTHTIGGRDGMFVSRDSGITWGRLTFPGDGPYRCHSIVFHPTTRDTLFTTIAARGAQSGIWKSTDGGVTWRQLKTGLPSPELMHRTSLAISPSRPAVMYAIAARSNEGVLGVFRSDNSGSSWINTAGNHFQREGQMSYGNTIAVHPTNPDHVLCGGVDLHLTQDGGATWVRTTKWDADRGTPNYAHADHHCLLMPPAEPGLVYDMNDGGMDVSRDGGLKWTNRSDGLAVTMFYDVDVAQTDSGFYGGGAQDNGTVVTTNGNPGAFFEITGGDGGWMIIDPRTPNHLYTTAQNMTVFRHRPSGGWAELNVPATDAEKDAVWMVILEMDPRDQRIVFLGGLRVWRTKDDGNNWQAVSAVLDGSPISAVEIAAANSKTVFVGTEKGGIFKSSDGGNTWSGDLSGSVLPGFIITRIATSPTNERIVYVTVANVGAGHVYKSTDGGITWVDTDGGRLPNVPHHAILIPGAKPSTVYVCSDAGVFVSTNAGGDWKNLTRNLPTVPIVDLVYHEADQALIAASYGRSMWRIKP